MGTTTETATQPAKLFIDVGNANTTENAVNAYSNVNDFNEYNCQNFNIGASAECGYSATSNVGNNTSNFIYMGINNSLFWTVQPYTIGGPNDTDILSLAGDMFLANGTTTSKNMYFLTGGVSTTTNLRMTIRGTGEVGVGTSSPWGLFSIQATTSLQQAPLFAVGSSTGRTLQGYDWMGGSLVGVQTAIAGGGNRCTGTSTLSSGLVTVLTGCVKTGDIIWIQRFASPSATVFTRQAASYMSSSTVPGVSFVASSSLSTDNSVIVWKIEHPQF